MAFCCFGGGSDEDVKKKLKAPAKTPPKSPLESKPSRSQRRSEPEEPRENASSGDASEGRGQSGANHSQFEPGSRVEHGPRMEPGARVESSPSPGGQKPRAASFKRTVSKKKEAAESTAGLHRSDSPPEIPRTDSREKRASDTDLGRNRSLRKHGSDRDPNSPSASGNPAADSPAPVVNRSMKLTQNLKAPPAKTPQQPAFSLSKRKPKDAATEARLQEEASKLDELLKSSDLRAFQYLELKAATRGFSMDMLIGAGGFGKVYRGLVKLTLQKDADPRAPNSEPLPVEVAIKRLEAKSLQGHKEWMVEICMLGLVNHPHLVKLLGFCAEGDKRLLVYEFLPYYSLDRYLFGLDPAQPILDWDTRLKIALGSARGLAHLHEEISPPIIYRDFKTSNVLLDEDFNPKLSDFGLAREGPSLDRTHVSTQVRGTAGYAAPEYMLTGHLTPKADVWSFGVVLLEMLTGRPSIDQRRPQHEMKLVPLARQRLQAPGDILDLMDPNLEGQFPPQAAAKLAEVAKWCLQSDPNNRPLMSELVEVLAYLSHPDQWEAA